MARPFSGIDPYLELPPYWGDFSPKLLTAIQNQLLEHLLPDFDVRMEEYPEFERHTERHLQIIHRATERVVTVIELLSPAYKTSGRNGLGKYVKKRTLLAEAD